MARGSLLTMALLSMAVSTLCRAGAHDIPEGYVRVAAVHGVPAEVLYAVSLTETVMAPSAIAGVMKTGCGFPPSVRCTSLAVDHQCGG